MADTEKLAFRILASLYPDSKPSEIRKIINDALAKEENMDDVSLWMALAKETSDPKKDDAPKKEIVEHHYYHHHDYWWQNNGVNLTGITYDSNKPLCNGVEITCKNNSGNTSISNVDFATIIGAATAWN